MSEKLAYYISPFGIKTGWGVPKISQQDIVYIVCQLNELATDSFQWCFTNGNATSKITRFYNALEHLNKIDWHSINSKDFSDNNSDGDLDRKRKKHAEFLVKDHVPSSYIKALIVYNKSAKDQVDKCCKKINFVAKVVIDKKNEFCF